MTITNIDAANEGISADDFTRLEPVPEAGMQRAMDIMRSGKLFRYGGKRPEDCEVALLERDFADYLGVRHALGVSSCTQAIELALLACGVEAGTRVLVPGFTFTAVPSAIVVLGAEPVFVECTDDYRIDLEDLERKIGDDTPVLLLSHMRGHICEMDTIMRLCQARGVKVVEDAAHALGARWHDQAVGTFGRVGCFSFQSNKIINAGEGGMLTTDDEQIIVKAIYLSGAYETNYRKHFNADSALFERYAGQLPAHNVRMNNLTAAVARPQLALLDERGHRYRQMYAYLEQHLSALGLELPRAYAAETRIPDSLQFRVPQLSTEQMQAFIAQARDAGLPLSGFADPNNARAFYNWRYLGKAIPELPQTRRSLQNVCDMRLSSTLQQRHLDYIVSTVRDALAALAPPSVKVAGQ
ncbi:aminotransferase class I/II-fold pyridoxal phosphate-dependent enzyme [Oleiagrimonas sp. C23AA]|uniref:DegT/DnrJ/EryC1/StrS family aminotransferase n=1 Tax=Oleiagrimonas sp. C23AA TaxID=2719047 RepID=UPI0014226A13|nr:aminotransferase class I/II-fold pyridoxal phosphate-dependent enzyme [Oleiagrimonas sp. C23AA]NII11859.1 aminotransferase class I/II-fold pyridoxal phosphate-dependent enzyme [Oleiagrimonas sp. C23AA]